MGLRQLISSSSQQAAAAKEGLAMPAAGVSRLFLASVLLFCFVGTCFSATGPSLKDINNSTLLVTASPHNGTYLKSGVDSITVTWGAVAGGDTTAWKSVTVKLCYAPISQKDRAWRKTQDPISKDKTCQFDIASAVYDGDKTVTWVVQRNTPSAYYFIRAYAYDAAGHPVSYGQTTSFDKKNNIFFVEAVSGRHVSLDIASVTFSAFSVVSLIGFFWLEKSRAAKSAAK